MTLPSATVPRRSPAPSTVIWRSCRRPYCRSPAYALGGLALGTACQQGAREMDQAALSAGRAGAPGEIQRSYDLGHLPGCGARRHCRQGGRNRPDAEGWETAAADLDHVRDVKTGDLLDWAERLCAEADRSVSIARSRSRAKGCASSVCHRETSCTASSPSTARAAPASSSIANAPATSPSRDCRKASARARADQRLSRHADGPLWRPGGEPRGNHSISMTPARKRLSTTTT